MEFKLEDFNDDFKNAINKLNEDLAALRVGRANPSVVENILVDSYGSKAPIIQLASITVPEARTIVIQPWDKTVIKDMEKAIIDANIGINPVNEGKQLRLTVPALTEESRKELTKLAGEKLEKSRITIRQMRDKVRDVISKKEKAKELTEDDRYDLQKELDEKVKKYNDQIKEIGESKEKEIMTI